MQAHVYDVSLRIQKIYEVLASAFMNSYKNKYIIMLVHIFQIIRV